MGLFDDTTRKLGDDAWGRHVKPERLAGHYEIYEGYDENPLSRVRRISRSARRSLQAAMDREALAMGALGLAIGLAIGAAMFNRRRR
ncbi:hypothetical protein [Phenylobacterium sp. SCN 70-31]|uniref:hypothetical protein n=1 Tax=Phenylobacterium sp. SCN 70-31 TaxID=1660129 RepID=UPI00086BDFC9|nr:hypothetical protein [Phenylobacterium sp. SCN 70-31]ODT88511.1 MAG: hypothetical protein ABS78_07835 [Phenylobacterium sp. SCN 70-31]